MLEYDWWFRRLYPLYNRAIGRDYVAVLKDLERTQWMPREHIKELQLEQLQGLIRHAWKNVPFYRDRWLSTGVTATSVDSTEDVARFPLVAKHDLRSYPQLFIADGVDPRTLHLHRTGGSTGEPVVFATDQATNAVSTADFYRALRWWGIDAGAKTVMFWGSPRFIVRSWTDKLRVKSLAIRHRLMNRRFYTNYNLDASSMGRAFAEIARFKPQLVRGMASSLYTFARYALDERLPLSDVGVRVVYSACEYLYDWERATIEQAFGCRVMNTYGLSEFGEIAFEHTCGNMHLMDENVLTELVTDPESGQREVVVTHLKNRSTPLIRYRTGDIAEEIRESCDCGLGLRTLHGLRGRAHDFILRPDGSVVHGQFFTHLLVYEPGLTRYQVVQETIDQFLIKLVISDDIDKGKLASRVTAGIRATVSRSATVTIEFVDSIPVEASGKFRWIVSKVANRASGRRCDTSTG